MLAEKVSLNKRFGLFLTDEASAEMLAILAVCLKGINAERGRCAIVPFTYLNLENGCETHRLDVKWEITQVWRGWVLQYGIRN